MEKRYQIGDKIYSQRPIVLGQLELLEPRLSGLDLDISSPTRLLNLLGGALPLVLAIVLLPEGMDARAACESEDVLAERGKDLKWSLEPEVSLEVIEDFFECNLTSSLSEKIMEMVGKLREHLKKATGWKELSTGFVSATSPGEEMSSGESKHAPPSPGSSFETGTGETSSPGS